MERLYLILDREGNALAQANLESPPGSEVLQMRLLEEPDMDFTKLGELQLIALDVKATSKRGTVTMQRGDRLVIRPSAVLGAEARENLRHTLQPIINDGSGGLICIKIGRAHF